MPSRLAILARPIMAEYPLPQSDTGSPAPADAAATAEGGSLHEQVESVLERIRPAVQSDGGDVELVDVTEEGVARIRLHGACIGCPSSKMTLHMGIERNLRQRVAGVTAVQQVD